MALTAAPPSALARTAHFPEAQAPNVDGSVAASIGAAFEAAVRARAPGVHASTPMVRHLAAKVIRELGLDTRTSALLDLAVRVRDIGMIALPDSVVLTTARLTPEEWTLVNRHPVIGAWMLEEFAAVAAAAPVVRAHHERWDGAGYPDGLSGDAIPLLSRVIAVCDAFVAMERDRPHRRGIGTEVALGQLCRERGAQFDARIVDALIAGLRHLGTSGASPATVRGKGTLQAATRRATPAQQGRHSQDVLIRAIEEFDVVPAFEPAVERALAAIDAHGRSQGELVATVESDIGITIAVLRRAQAGALRRPIANVPDAVAALTRAETRAAIATLPRAKFPWRTSPLEVVLHQGRVHAQAVMRAADRIARELGLAKRDDVLAAALLHDVGKLVLARANPEYSDTFDVRTSTPEQRVRQEQRAPSLDHATVGGLLLRRWGLPRQLMRTVAAHHRAGAADEVATYVRLADMIAHHGQGDAVDRGRMLRLCQLCGLSVEALRDVLFDLPHSGASQLRRADPSPLSTRESQVLHVLAQGKVYKVIGHELGLSTSTVRSHLHNTYEKLGVTDRAQAVLRATEMGWI